MCNYNVIMYKYINVTAKNFYFHVYLNECKYVPAMAAIYNFFIFTIQSLPNANIK